MHLYRSYESNAPYQKKHRVLYFNRYSGFMILPVCYCTDPSVRLAGSFRSVGWFVSLLVREEVLLASLCEKKILFRLKIYDRLRQATAKRTGC